MRLVTFRVAFLAVATILLTAVSASALVVSYYDSHSMSFTNWDALLTFNRFDPGLGTLNFIKFTLAGDILGDVQFESLDSEPATVSTSLSSVITLFRPDLSTIVVTTPVANNTDLVSEFDGVIDFAGNSGRTRTGLTASGSDFAISPPPGSDLALFTGLGTISLPVYARGVSTASGAGNLITIFRTQAAANVSVTYDYTPTTPPVPEPSSLALLLFGGGGLAIGRRIRKGRK